MSLKIVLWIAFEKYTDQFYIVDSKLISNLERVKLNRDLLGQD